MPLQVYISPWVGYAVRHIPDTPGKSYDIYDFKYCSQSNENRWNIVGEPTLYLAKEKDVALAEYARHFRVDRTLGLAAQTYRRQVFRFRVDLEYVLDLRKPKVWAELSLENAPDCFKDKNIADYPSSTEGSYYGQNAQSATLHLALGIACLSPVAWLQILAWFINSLC